MSSSTRGGRRSVGAVVMVTLLLLAPIAGVAGGTVTPSSPPSDQVVSLSNDVSLWERAAFPLRVDQSQATTTVPNAGIQISPPNEAPIDLNYNTLGVFSPGDSTTIQMEERTGAIGLDNTQVELIAVKVTGSQSDFEAAIQDFSVSKLNDVGSFELVGTQTTDSTGSASYSYTFDSAGQYVFIAATADSGNGFEVTGGELSVDGSATIVGVDQASVQNTASSVTPSATTVTPGSSVTFTANSNLGSGTTDHMVVLYDDATFQNQGFTFSYTNDLPNTLDFQQDATLETTIAEVDGVSRVDGSPSFQGYALSSGQTSGPVSIVSLANELRNGVSNGHLVPTVNSPSTTTLYASSTAVEGASTESITVETTNAMPDGTYRYVHIAEQGSKVSTSTGTISLDSSSSDGSAPPTGGDDDPSSNPDPVPTPEPPQQTQPPSQGADVSVTKTGGSVTVNVKNVAKGRTVTITTNTASENAEVSLDGMTVTPSSNASFNMTAEATTTLPKGTPPLDKGKGKAAGYLNITHTQSDSEIGEVTFNFRVKKSNLAAAGINPRKAALYRFHDGEWQELKTTLKGEDSEYYTFKSTSPGLSAFAVGQSESQGTITSTSLTKTTVEPGETFRARATIENQGRNNVTYLANLTVDGEFVTQREVDVPSGETRQVSFAQSFDEPGTYDIGISGNSVGTVTVEQQTTPEPTPEPTPTPEDPDPTPTAEPPTETPEDDSGGFPMMFGAVILVLLGLIAGGVYYYREQ